MNHSIYSADRTTHLKIVVVALVAGIAVAGFGISARITSDDGYTQTARVIKAGKPVAITSSDTSTGPLTEFEEFTRLFTSPPKSPRGYLEDPNYPQVDYRKTPAPHGRFLFAGARIASRRTSVSADAGARRRHGLDQLAGETIGAGRRAGRANRLPARPSRHRSPC